MDQAQQNTLVSLGGIDVRHLRMFKLALDNILTLQTAETTYAQIVDGLPLRDIYAESHWPVPDIVPEHKSLCDSALQRARDARAKLDITDLLFQQQAVDRYVNAAIGKRYPRGVADIVGYWAETRIFGGVVVFDRGIMHAGNGGVYFHSDRSNFGGTLYPPTDAQFSSLVRFLTSSSVPSEFTHASPLPIVPSLENRWRWDPGLAFLHWNIFRDHYERVVPDDYQQPRHKLRVTSWPEVGDDSVITVQQFAQISGEPVDHDAIAKAMEHLKMITPTSPKWKGPLPDKDEVDPPWKPPYFRD
ncbi:hypothetical protein SCUCBS95973_004430 [Sporothrix curviconia]|uniref:Uncharacterized protein n=1 Tax=Sporothrix curviconia TaxID=1260050 RepID=A0ABP0BNZ6_9PEZI